MQADPIGYAAGMNLYGYVSGDPVNTNDPSGTEGCVYVTGSRICYKTDSGSLAKIPGSIVGWKCVFGCGESYIKDDEYVVSARIYDLILNGDLGISSTIGNISIGNDGGSDCGAVFSPAANLPPNSANKVWRGNTLGDDPTPNYRKGVVQTSLPGDDRVAMTAFMLLSKKARDFAYFPIMMPYGAPGMIGLQSKIRIRYSNSDDDPRVEIPTNTFNGLNVREIIHFRKDTMCRMKK